MTSPASESEPSWRPSRGGLHARARIDPWFFCGSSVAFLVEYCVAFLWNRCGTLCGTAVEHSVTFFVEPPRRHPRLVCFCTRLSSDNIFTSQASPDDLRGSRTRRPQRRRNHGLTKRRRNCYRADIIRLPPSTRAHRPCFGARARQQNQQGLGKGPARARQGPGKGPATNAATKPASPSGLSFQGSVK